MEKRRILLKADIHCMEPIPCNPCETSCPFQAITVGPDITALPIVDTAACTGCGVCVAVCPGLAIRLVEEKSSAGPKRVVVFPYEYQDPPEIGESVEVVDMQGMIVGQALVVNRKRPLKEDPTLLIHVEVDATLADVVWSIRCNKGKVEHA